MLKQISILGTIAVLMWSCNSNRVEVVDNVKQQIHEKVSDGKKSAMGDIISFHLVIKNHKDSVIKSSYTEGAPIIAQIQKPPFLGSFEQGLNTLSKGDSATFFVPVDSLFKGYPQIPPIFSKGTDVKFTVKILNVQNQKDFEKTRDMNRAKQRDLDKKIIADYITKEKIANSKLTESGISYTIDNPGSGTAVTAGDSITVKYAGKLLNGKQFDANTFTLQIGMGMVIPGWDEGLTYFKQGEKGKLIIPSPLAYGEQGSPPTIPANSILVFDVEILSVKKAKK